MISRCFQRFVKSAPANFYGCTEAIQFLATPLNVKHDTAQVGAVFLGHGTVVILGGRGTLGP